MCPRASEFWDGPACLDLGSFPALRGKWGSVGLAESGEDSRVRDGSSPILVAADKKAVLATQTRGRWTEGEKDARTGAQRLSQKDGEIRQVKVRVQWGEQCADCITCLSLMQGEGCHSFPTIFSLGWESITRTLQGAGATSHLCPPSECRGPTVSILLWLRPRFFLSLISRASPPLAEPQLWPHYHQPQPESLGCFLVELFEPLSEPCP